MNEYAVLVDLAKKRDFTSIMIMQDVPEIVQGIKNRIIHYYDIRQIEKYQGMRYTEISKRVSQIMDHTVLKNNADLIVDGTGVGEAEVDIMRDDKLYPIPIIFTGGMQPQYVYCEMGSVFGNIPGKLQAAKVLKEIHVPKVDLVSAGVLVLQQKRIRIAPSRWTEDFRKQLENFRGKVNEKTRNVKLEAVDESIHDDFVVSFLMGAWWFTKYQDEKEIPEREITTEETVGFDPMDFMV